MLFFRFFSFNFHKRILGFYQNKPFIKILHTKFIKHSNLIQLKFQNTYTILIINYKNKINSHAIICHSKSSCQKYDESSNYLQLNLWIFYYGSTIKIRTRQNPLSRNQVIRYIDSGSMIPPKLFKILNNQMEPKLTDYMTNTNKFMKFLSIQGKSLIKANKLLLNLNRPFNASKKKKKCWQPKKANFNQLLPTNKKYYILFIFRSFKKFNKTFKT